MGDSDNRAGANRDPENPDTGQRMSRFGERARSALANVGQDDRFKQAAAVTKDAAGRAEEASKSVSRKVTQEDSWDELRNDVELLTEIARAHHALINDLIDRVASLENREGIEPGARNDR